MLPRMNVLIASAVLAGALFVLPINVWAAELPEGVDVQVVAEYPADIPGVDKVLLRKIVLQPGAKWAEVPINDQVFCAVEQGVVTVVDHGAGTTTLYTPGSRWAPTKGSSVTISNPGDETHVHWVYAIIAKP